MPAAGGRLPVPVARRQTVKVRDRGRVVSKAVVVAYAVHESGVREVIGLDVGEVESGAFWVEFLRALKRAAWTVSAWRSPISTRG